MRFTRYLAGLVLVGALAACSDDALEVENPNDPDRERVLANAADVEGLASSQFQQILTATLGSIARVNTALMTMGFENSSALNNNGLGPRSIIPRSQIDNGRGNAYASENYADFRLLSSVARNSADILARSKVSGFTLGAGRDGDVNRLKAWAHFTYGVALGYLSLVYDSAGIPRTTDAGGVIPPLEGFAAVNVFALAQFDSAAAYAARTGTTALPANWLTGPTGPTVPVARFIQVIRSFKAKMRAGVAHTPAERAAVDWNAVIADANAGITEDLVINTDPAQGWDHAWLSTGLHFRDANWHQMTYYIIGMADTTGAFDAWLATARDDRTPFLIRSPDLRFPQGETRAAQNADRGGQVAPTGRKYFRNRDPGGDQSGSGWMNSFYDHYRFRAWADAGRIGAKVFFAKTENDMLAAEGHIRAGNIAAAAALIDRTRTTAGLPALAGTVTTATQAVPGGNACVPRVPVATGTACGNIMEAMKWEKRMETAFTTYGSWYFDGRGWGDLVVGTALQWAVPYQEADARILPIYTYGGLGGQGSATTSTYGYGVGSR
ncbi:MAG: hypothetical protein ACT4O1_02255 [Gemmatimonadota bacterium]